MKRWILFLMIAAVAVPLVAQSEEGTGPARGASVDTTGKGYTAAIVMEPNTKRVLFEENADVMLPTASMAKMMTLLIAMEEFGAGNLKMDTPVTISARASQMGGSQVYLRAGDVWPVKNLIIATMVHSANDAALALAEKISGSSEGFADLMNDRAKTLGLTNSQFYDPHGLPNSEDPKRINMMSARDLALLGAELMKYPFMRQLAVIPEMPFKNGTLEMIYNPNHLINPKRPDYYDSATGIKTGFTASAGYCVTSSAKRNNMELVAVVMGAKPPRGPLSSFGISRKLFNDAFNNYRMVTPLKKGATVGEATVEDGAQKKVAAVAATDANALVKRGEEKNVKVNFAPQAVRAPIQAGQQVGTIVIEHAGEQLARIPAIASVSVDKEAWYRKLLPF